MKMGSEGKSRFLNRRTNNRFISRLSELFHLKRHNRSDFEPNEERLLPNNKAIHRKVMKRETKFSKKPENVTSIVSPIASPPLSSQRINSKKFA